MDALIIVVSTPDETDVQQLWQVTFTGLLRWELETVGSGAGEMFPPEVYDIYHLEGSDEMKRWEQRLRFLEEGSRGSPKVLHIVLASSLFQGWGDREYLDGIHIICRGYEIAPAPAKYAHLKYTRPTIDGAPD